LGGAREPRNDHTPHGAFTRAYETPYKGYSGYEARKDGSSGYANDDHTVGPHHNHKKDDIILGDWDNPMSPGIRFRKHSRHEPYPTPQKGRFKNWSTNFTSVDSPVRLPEDSFFNHYCWDMVHAHAQQDSKTVTIICPAFTSTGTYIRA